METIKKLLDLLTPHERRRAGLLFSMMLIMALLDMIGVASIMPFMAVIANPDLIETNAVFSMAYTTLNFQDPTQFLFALGVLVFVLLITSLAFKMLVTYAQLRFSLLREYSIGKRLVVGYLHQPYSWFLDRHSADLGKTVLSEVSAVINGSMRPMLNLIANSVVAIFLLTLLIIIDPVLALTVGGVLGSTYALIYKATGGFLTRIGKERVEANQRRFAVVSEAFGAAKEVKVGGLEQVYIKYFSGPALIYAKHLATAQVVGQLPRFAMEAIAFGGLLLVTLYLMAQNNGFASALPIISLYVFAGYRLIPALQKLYAAATQLRFAGPALDALHADLTSLKPAIHRSSQEPLQLTQSICLNNINYTYPNAPHLALKGITLSIPAKSTVGVVGSTGSGKTTLVDLILGLLVPQKGTLEIDGQVIDEHNSHAWQCSIGYVPQQIYLADDTLSANIAFGIDGQDIDQKEVERAAKIANLDEFVTNDLPNGYETTVGERGVRLSGGQRQRIGIARALYHKPQVLILDEATSALDNLTEKAVMEAVHNLGHEITVILIAHRLSTVRECDTIFLLEKGALNGQGSYDELIQANQRFSVMAATH